MKFPELLSCSPNISIAFSKNAWGLPFWNIRTKSVCQRFIRISPPPVTKYLTFWNATDLPIISCSAGCFLNGFMPLLRKSESTRLPCSHDFMQEQNGQFSYELFLIPVKHFYGTNKKGPEKTISSRKYCLSRVFFFHYDILRHL